MKDSKIYPNFSQFNPAECISGKMMRCNRIVANVFRKHLTQFKITDSQMSIIFIISKIKKCNQKKISDFLYLEKSTVNRNINRLLQNKLISYNDKKELLLTKEGKLLLNNVIPHWKNAMSEIRSILEEEGESALNLLAKQLMN